ncbi:non-reducing end alpha-L-arabinofuranosidase family hydrolase [Streptomyces sp. NPDC054863]
MSDSNLRLTDRRSISRTGLFALTGAAHGAPRVPGRRSPPVCAHPGAVGSTGRRHFRSFTSTSLTGTWTPTPPRRAIPSPGRTNFTFPGGTWTQDHSHSHSQMAGAGGDRLRLPWRRDQLTRTHST